MGGVVNDLGALIERLAATPAVNDSWPTALDLRVEGMIRQPWTQVAGTRQGARLGPALREACSRAGLVVPTSLARSVAAWGGLVLNESLLEGLARQYLGAGLPLDRLWEGLEREPPMVESHEALVTDLRSDIYRAVDGVAGYIHVGRRPARGLACVSEWDVPMLLAAADLGTEGTPPWLAYLPTASDQGTPAVLPLALDFEGLLWLHLTGCFALLACGESTLERSLGALRQAPPEVRPALRVALDETAKAATTLESRDDVRVPGMHTDMPEPSVVVATLRELRVGDLAAADPGCADWLDVTFAGVSSSRTLSAEELATFGTAILSAARARTAPLRPTVVMHAAFAHGAAGYFTDLVPSFVEGPPSTVAARLEAVGLRIVRPDALGDIVKPCSLADGAAHVLERVERARGVA